MSEQQPEFIPGGQAIWQPEKAKTYRCPVCRMFIFSQYQGTEEAYLQECLRFEGHWLRWTKPDAASPLSEKA